VVAGAVCGGASFASFCITVVVPFQQQHQSQHVAELIVTAASPPPPRKGGSGERLPASFLIRLTCCLAGL
jgi:hypothetical protein